MITEHYFKSLEFSPILFTNELLSTFKDTYGQLFLYEFDIIDTLEELLEVYNNHLPYSKFVGEDGFNEMLETSEGDYSIFILLLYLISIEDKHIPLAVVNLKTVYKMIQETFKEYVIEDNTNKQPFNHLDEFLIMGTVKKLRDGN